jgi:chromosome partitioning protein
MHACIVHQANVCTTEKDQWRRRSSPNRFACAGVNMRTIAVISQKGGAGKTTLALHLGVAFSLAGQNTAIIDLDPQASAAKWGDRRRDELPVCLSAHASRLPQEMRRVADNGGEVLIIDTAPHSDSAALDSARAADLVLIPCRPAILDIEAVASTISLVQTTGKPMVVVMNAVGSSVNETNEAVAAIAEMGVEVAPVRITNRVVFSRSLVTGRTAPEFEPGSKAADEIAQLHTFALERLNAIKPSQSKPTLPALKESA